MKSFYRFYQYVLIFLVIAPIVFLCAQSILTNSLSDSETWRFILDHMLVGLVKNTALLMLATVFLSIILGVSQASLICLTNIPAKKILHILFILPLIFPLYVLAFVYVGSFTYSGSIPVFFRSFFNFDLTALFAIKSTMGVAMVFSLALAPYVYLFLRAAFLRIDEKLIFSARSLGQRPFKILFGLLMPQIRPWIYASAILVALEVLCDFGGVSVFNYDTFSTAIYHSWIGLFSLNTAVKLSLIPGLFALLLYFANNFFYRTYKNETKLSRSFVLFELTFIKKTILLMGSLSYCFFSVFFPVGQIFIWASSALSLELNLDYLLIIAHTLLISLGAAVFIALLSLLLVNLQRNYSSQQDRSITIFVKIGYALPGSIIAIALMSVFSLLNINFFATFAFIALLFAYLVRFFSVAFEIQSKAYDLISKKYDWTSYSLGKAKFKTFYKVHLPILLPTLISSMIMLLLEIMKEMPMTLMLRPFGVNTLATKIYELTSEGEWERASISAALLILLGALTIFLSEYYQTKKNEGL